MRIKNNLLILVCVAMFFVGGASATEYYVSTTGDNAYNGLTLGTAWESIQYGFETMHAGDTLYILNGTYYEDPVGTYKACVSGEYIDHNANATHQITLTAYNGTPTIVRWKSTIEAGIMLVNDDYINIDGISIDGVNDSNRLPEGIRARSCRNVNITNCSVYYTSTGIQIYQRGNYTIIENCSVYNTYWNAITLSNNGLGVGTMHHISVLNCTINHTDDHNGIDMIDNLEHINLIGNSVNGVRNGIYVHGTDGLGYHFNDTIVQGNTITNSRTNGMYVNRLYNWTLSDNIVTGSGDSSIIMAQAHNVTFSNNSADGLVEVSGTDLTSDMDTIYSRRLVSGDLVVQDFRGDNISMKSYNGITDIEILFTDGRVMNHVWKWDAGYDSYYSPVEYYPDKSNFTMGSTGVGSGLTRLVTPYAITLQPSSGYLCNVSMNHEADAADDRTNIAVNSSVGVNPTWINGTMMNVSANYSVSVDGSVVTHLFADSEGVVSYHYMASWSPHTFEFDWVGRGVFSADHTKAYYNLTSPVKNTVNLTGYHIYNKTLGWDDNISSGKLGVTI